MSDSFAIPFLTECCVCTKVDFLDDKVPGTFSPYKDKLAEMSLIAAQSLSYCNNGLIPVRLYNLKDSEVRIFKNTVLGNFEIDCNVDDCEEGDINVIENQFNFNEFSRVIDEKISKISHLNENELLQAKSLLK